MRISVLLNFFHGWVVKKNCNLTVTRQGFGVLTEMLLIES